MAFQINLPDRGTQDGFVDPMNQEEIFSVKSIWCIDSQNIKWLFKCFHMSW